jgi:hypothetical protein
MVHPHSVLPAEETNPMEPLHIHCLRLPCQSVDHADVDDENVFPFLDL